MKKTNKKSLPKPKKSSAVKSSHPRSEIATAKNLPVIKNTVSTSAYTHKKRTTSASSHSDSSINKNKKTNFAKKIFTNKIALTSALGIAGMGVVAGTVTPLLLKNNDDNQKNNDDNQTKIIKQINSFAPLSTTSLIQQIGGDASNGRLVMQELMKVLDGFYNNVKSDFPTALRSLFINCGNNEINNLATELTNEFFNLGIVENSASLEFKNNLNKNENYQFFNSEYGSLPQRNIFSWAMNQYAMNMPNDTRTDWSKFDDKIPEQKELHVSLANDYVTKYLTGEFTLSFDVEDITTLNSNPQKVQIKITVDEQTKFDYDYLISGLGQNTINVLSNGDRGVAYGVYFSQLNGKKNNMLSEETKEWLLEQGTKPNSTTSSKFETKYANKPVTEFLSALETNHVYANIIDPSESIYNWLFIMRNATIGAKNSAGNTFSILWRFTQSKPNPDDDSRFWDLSIDSQILGFRLRTTIYVAISKL